jgi:hypothetical protein
MSETDSRPTYVTYVFLALVLAVVAYARIRLLSTPLERDEGEFAYIGQLLLKGTPPFTDAYTMKLPGVSFAYALFMLLFGQSAAAIRIGLLIVNGICIFQVYLLARRLFGRSAALLSCASYAALSLSESVLGIFAHATHFVVLFALAGLLLIMRAFDKGSISLLSLSGLCLGLAFTMKQHAALFIVYAFLFLAWRNWKTSAFSRKRFLTGNLLLLSGVTLPYALLALWTAQAGTFDAFWFWTVRYAREYATGPTLRQGIAELTASARVIVSAQPLLWLLAISGGVLLCTKYHRCTDRPFVFGFLLFSFLAVCPGLAFREHYFVMLLPAVAILTGAGLTSASFVPAAPSRLICRCFIPIVLLAAATCYGFYQERHYLFIDTPRQVSRQTYGANPFPEAPEIARYLKEHSAPGDRIAILGSEPEILFYADRLSATGYIYMYGLMENQPYAEQMQLQMIREIEAARPKYLIVINVNSSWLMTSSSKLTVLDWITKYASNRYDLDGVIDIVDAETTLYRWGKEAKAYQPVSDSYITVFARKD